MRKISEELDESTIKTILEKLEMTKRFADTTCAGCGTSLIMDRYERFVKCRPQFCEVCKISGVAEDFKDKNKDGDNNASV